MSTFALDSPALVLEQLQAIERDLAGRQHAYESAARDWFLAKRDREKQHAIAYRRGKAFSERVADCEAFADQETADIGAVSEAEFMALKAVVDVLSTRASICQSILRAQGRA